MWVVLTMVLAADTLTWSLVYSGRSRDPGGLVPSLIVAIISPQRAVHFRPTLEMAVSRPDAMGRRTFARTENIRTDTSDAEYVVTGYARPRRLGLWAPCVAWNDVTLEAFTWGTSTPPPSGLEQEALNAHANQPMPPAEAVERDRLVALFRAGASPRPIWLGLLHDAILLPLALLWLVAAPPHIRLGLRLLIGTERRVDLRTARRQKGLCEQCGYDLGSGGLSRCPECGIEPANGSEENDSRPD